MAETLKRKDVLPQIRGNRRGIEQNRKAIAANTDSIKALQDEITELRELVAGSTTKPEKPTGEIPESIRSTADVVKFIKNHPELGEEWATQWVSSKKLQSREVSRRLAESYTDIELVNDQKEHHNYEAGEDKHQDAVVLIPDHSNRKMDEIYDITIGSSAAGSILSKDGKHDACWNKCDEYPAGWENKPND